MVGENVYKVGNQHTLIGYDIYGEVKREPGNNNMFFMSNSVIFPNPYAVNLLDILGDINQVIEFTATYYTSDAS